MRIQRRTVINGQAYPVLISDESEALQAAYAAGRAVVGLWHREGRSQDLSPAAYVVENLEDADEAFLERAARRFYGFPWVIAVTRRLVIRELTCEDARYFRGRRDPIWSRFADQDYLKPYIQNQYGFYEYGFWGLEKREGGELIGIAGVSQMEDGEETLSGGKNLALFEKQGGEKLGNPALELGYALFLQHRHQGYGLEACRAILDYAREQWPGAGLYARTGEDNRPSVDLLIRLGFVRSKNTGPPCQGADREPR